MITCYCVISIRELKQGAGGLWIIPATLFYKHFVSRGVGGKIYLGLICQVLRLHHLIYCQMPNKIYSQPSTFLVLIYTFCGEPSFTFKKDTNIFQVHGRKWIYLSTRWYHHKRTNFWWARSQSELVRGAQ